MVAVEEPDHCQMNYHHSCSKTTIFRMIIQRKQLHKQDENTYIKLDIDLSSCGTQPVKWLFATFLFSIMVR